MTLMVNFLDNKLNTPNPLRQNNKATKKVVFAVSTTHIMPISIALLDNLVVTSKLNLCFEHKFWSKLDFLGTKDMQNSVRGDTIKGIGLCGNPALRGDEDKLYFLGENGEGLL
ncbi:hypothetical protein ABEB36_014850 [Hypothenemus hampei]|uniref:Uncharacterized protein n=1 Tax=Hypothenemus hampei TaxID=57062 RepID=A0ABD1E126_HYPHA